MSDLTQRDVWFTRLKGFIFGLTISGFALIVGVPILVFHVVPYFLSKKYTANGTSVEVLVKAFEGLEGLEVLTCQYTAIDIDHWSIMPAPINRESRSSGWFTLSGNSATSLRSRGQWILVPRDQLPKSLRAIVPQDAQLTTSEEFNNNFNDGRSSHHSRVVLTLDGNTAYFATCDDEHSLE